MLDVLGTNPFNFTLVPAAAETTTTMPTVWVSLYYKGKKNPDGQPYDLKVNGRKVSSLKDAVKEDEDLKCHVRKIEVYAPGTNLSSKATIEDPGKDLTESSSTNPFVVVVPRAQEAEGVSLGKRPASEISSVIYSSYESNVDQVYGILRAEATKLRVLYPDDDYCDPVEVTETWKEVEIRAELQKKRAELRNIVQRNEAKSPRVLAQRLGTGCGKSHILVNAHRLLGVDKRIYIAYNMGQSLKIDIDYDRKSILVRVVLMCLGSSNKGCDNFLNEPSTKQLLDLELAFLRRLAIYSLKQFNNGNPVVISVDEVRQLDIKSKSVRVVPTVVSELGEIVYSLHVQNTECVVIASTLEQRTFQTDTERKVQWIDSQKVDEKAFDFLVEKLLLSSHLHQIPLIKAVSGLHFRSMLQAIRTVNEGIVPEVTVPLLMQIIYEKLTARLEKKDIASIRDYVKNCISQGANAGEPEKYTDSVGAVAPSLIWACFEEGHPARKIFCTSALVSKEKQLELCGYEYDMVRAKEELPFLPFGVKVFNADDPGWYEKLRFYPNLEKSDRSIFVTVGRDKKVQRSDTNLDLRDYYLPKDVIHPWIDRLCFCRHSETNETCIVLYQDKINKDLPKAVDSLNDAADLLSKEFPEYKLLCVSHVAGAQQGTTKQKDLKYPYMLIREDEVEGFYSSNFAPAIRFVRLRHTNGV